MTPETLADLEMLRQAAKLMRERAKAATPAGWSGGYTHFGDVILSGGPTETGYRLGTVFAFEESCKGCVRPSPETFAHIESFADPAVALAVADLLDAAIGEHVQDEDTGVAWTDCPTAALAVAVARAYLRRDQS